MKLVITDRYPDHDASGVYINDVIWAQFSKPLLASSATYYNFSVNERNSYEAVEGSVLVQSVSGNIDNAVIVFTPTNGLSRNTEYMVLASTGLTASDGDALDHDDSWFFKTGNTAASGNIGDSIYDLDPSGFTVSGVATDILISSGVPLAVIATDPQDYDSNVSRALPYIKVQFNGTIPSGINLYDHISLSTRGVLG